MPIANRWNTDIYNILYIEQETYSKFSVNCYTTTNNSHCYRKVHAVKIDSGLIIFNYKSTKQKKLFILNINLVKQHEKNNKYTH